MIIDSILSAKCDFSTFPFSSRIPLSICSASRPECAVRRTAQRLQQSPALLLPANPATPADSTDVLETEQEVLWRRKSTAYSSETRHGRSQPKRRCRGRCRLDCQSLRWGNGSRGETQISENIGKVGNWCENWIENWKTKNLFCSKAQDWKFALKTTLCIFEWDGCRKLENEGFRVKTLKFQTLLKFKIFVARPKASILRIQQFLNAYSTKTRFQATKNNIFGLRRESSRPSSSSSESAAPASYENSTLLQYTVSTLDFGSDCAISGPCRRDNCSHISLSFLPNWSLLFVYILLQNPNFIFRQCCEQRGLPDACLNKCHFNSYTKDAVISVFGVWWLLLEHLD